MEMASNWYYVKDGATIGPVSSRQLKQLAENGTLSSSDLVWKDGMKDWQQASQVIGLFEATPATPQPPSVPEPTSGTPSINSAAKQLFAAVSAKAHELGAKAGDKVKAVQASVQESLAPALQQTPRQRLPVASSTGTIQKIKVKTFLYFSCAGIVLLSVACGVFALVFDSSFEDSGASGLSGTLRSFNDHPPSIRKSISQKKEVWMLNDFRFPKDAGKAVNVYLVIGGDSLESIVIKQHATSLKETLGEYRWERHDAGESQRGKGLTVKVNGSRNENGLHVTKSMKYRFDEDVNSILEGDEEISIDLRWNPKGDECSWEAERTKNSIVIARGQEFPSHDTHLIHGFGKRLSP